ncbi:MAG: hypothetical protein FWB72_01955 [Firmicutes bacterium]|nr:hypothetical protein [Bacillota bacterium]
MSDKTENLVLPTTGKQVDALQMQSTEGGSTITSTIQMRLKVSAVESAFRAGELQGWTKSTYQAGPAAYITVHSPEPTGRRSSGVDTGLRVLRDLEGNIHRATKTHEGEVLWEYVREIR